MKDLLGVSAAVFSVTLLIPSASAYTPGVAPAATSCTYVATAPYSLTISWAVDAGRPKSWTLLARDGILGVTPPIEEGRVPGAAGSAGFATFPLVNDPANSNVVLGNRNGSSADLACTAAVAAPAAPVVDAAPVTVEAASAAPVLEAAPATPEAAIAPVEVSTGQ